MTPSLLGGACLTSETRCRVSTQMGYRLLKYGWPQLLCFSNLKQADYSRHRGDHRFRQAAQLLMGEMDAGHGVWGVTQYAGGAGGLIFPVQARAPEACIQLLLVKSSLLSTGGIFEISATGA